jgi:hypothetical protein
MVNQIMNIQFLLIRGLALFILIWMSLPNVGHTKSIDDPYQITSFGDQSTIQLKVNNFGSSPREFHFGPKTGPLVQQSIASYGAHTYLFQCLNRNDIQKTPSLDFVLGETKAHFYDWMTRSEDPRKIIWNRGSLKSTNQLKWPLRRALNYLYHRPVRSVRTTSFLTHLSGWTRVELFLTSLKALSDLNDEQLSVLKMMVTTGTTLVIGTGDMEGDEKLVQKFIPVSLGQVKPTGGALLEQLPRVSSYRRLFPRSGADPIVIADDEPIAVESQLGLGRVRVLAVRLNELTTTEIANRVLKSDWQARDQLEEWLDLSMPPLTQSPRLLNDQVWLMMILIPMIFIVARGRWRIITVGVILWIALALIRPPLFVPTSIRRAHLLYIPMDDGAIVLAQVDLNSFDRGGRAEPIQAKHLSLISTETQGACVIHMLDQRHRNQQKSEMSRKHENQSWWVIDSELGERQRFKYVVYAPSIPRASTLHKSETISDWPPGPWSGAQIEPLSPIAGDLPIPVDLKGVKAWRVPMSKSFKASQPLVYKRTINIEE